MIDTTNTTIPLTQFPHEDAPTVFATRTPGCDGCVVVSAFTAGIELRARGCDEIGGPPDDDYRTPNSGTIAGLTPSEARELAGLLMDAAAITEANG